MDEGSYRRARAESMTLNEDTAEQVDTLLEALSVHSRDSPTLPTPRPESPLERPQSRAIRRILSNDRLPPQLPAPIRRLPSYPKTPDFSVPSDPYNRVGSPSPRPASEVSSYPATPSDTLPESFILPPREFGSMSSSLDRRGSSSLGPTGNCLETLPETERLDIRHSNPSFTLQPGAPIDPSVLEAASLSSRSDARQLQQPPTSWSSHHAQLINQFSNYSMDAPPTPTSSRLPSLTGSSVASERDGRHLSVMTSSTDLSDHKPRTPSTPSSDFKFHYDSSLSRSNTIMSGYDSRSVSSGSTGTFSKRMEKLEKKM